jgi:hypothetical protein
VEWLWRRGWPDMVASLARPVRAASRWTAGQLDTAGSALNGLARQVFAADGWVSLKVPPSVAAVASLAILGLVLAIALFS